MPDKELKPWCHWQIKCSEDTPETWTCSAHASEGRSFKCPYTDYTDSQERKFACQDATQPTTGCVADAEAFAAKHAKRMGDMGLANAHIAKLIQHSQEQDDKIAAMTKERDGFKGLLSVAKSIIDRHCTGAIAGYSNIEAALK